VPLVECGRTCSESAFDSMTTDSLHSLCRLLSPAWAFGPIFAKELRVSSRHRRNYALRFAYLISLTIFVAVVWVDQMRWVRSGGVFSASRMPETGKNITAYVVLFQFWAAQLVTIVILSTSFSDEIYHRTLGLLMTTPITNRQIVLGKLFSKLLQLLQLLAITLPLLAIVRVFGGVAWGYLIASFCVTVTAVLFVGSVTILMSMLFRQPYSVIIATVVVLGAVFGFPSVVIAMMRGQGVINSTLVQMNPYVMLALLNEQVLDPSSGLPLAELLPAHFAFMVGASVAVLYVCTKLVRKVALFQAASRAGLFLRMWRSGWGGLAGLIPAGKPSTKIRRVTGPPVVWKELVCRISSREKLIAGIIIGTEIAMILAIYLFFLVAREVGYNDAHKCYVLVFMGIGLIFTAIMPATCITSEKEAHSWPLLLTTTLSDWDILRGKFAGALRRCLPIWALLFAYVGLFWYARCLHGAALVEMAIIVAGILALVICSGLYFSSRCKRTSVAVISNLVMVVGLCLILVMLPTLRTRAMWPLLEDLCESGQYAVPFVQASVVIDAAAEVNVSAPSYEWLDQNLDREATMRILLVSTAGYMFLGILFAALAKRRLRRDPF